MVGWFGFNAAAPRANGLAGNALWSPTAAAMAGLTWAILDRIFNSRPHSGVITGTVAGLVAISGDRIR